MSQINRITVFRQENAFLSNMYPVQIVYDGGVYNCVESAFQAAKIENPADRTAFFRLDGKTAKSAGLRVKLRADWDSIKLVILRELLQIKFAEDPLYAKLLSTGDAELIETNAWHDNFYGDCLCSRCIRTPGQNMLGKLLIEVRSSIA